ncbi:MAG: hypothetical protein GX201_06150 [Clostridiales bacterium]|nr:hypothetical protein [Clostridiales bacterium]
MAKPTIKYEINLCMPTSDEDIKSIRKKTVKAFEKLIKEYVNSLAISEKEKKYYYENMIGTVSTCKELDRK